MDARETAKLVDNSVRHGRTLPARIRLALMGTGQLLIDMLDLNPTFPRFDKVLKKPSEAGHRRPSLGLVQRAGAKLTYEVREDRPGKTARAVLPVPTTARGR